MVDHAEGLKQPEQNFIFVFKHPPTQNGCPNIGATQQSSLSAIDINSAKMLAENTSISCVNPSCGAKYELQNK